MRKVAEMPATTQKNIPLSLELNLISALVQEKKSQGLQLLKDLLSQ
jgi:hypothetical protein